MTQRFIVGSAILCGLALVAFPLQAQDFSADVTVKTADGKVNKGEFYHTANKDRYDSAGTRLITDREQKLIYLVEPAKKLILVNHALRAADNATDNSCADLLKAAFGTQLLCEQVFGRALRRQSYDLNEEGLFNVEYADVLGIPFDFTAKPVIAPPQPPPGHDPNWRAALRRSWPSTTSPSLRARTGILKPNSRRLAHMLSTAPSCLRRWRG